MNFIYTIIASLISGGLGAWLTYYFGIKSKKTEAMLKFKEERYAKLLVYLQGFIGQTSSGELKKKFFEENYRTWLYCSDDVVKSINDLTNHLQGYKGQTPNPERGHKIVGNIVLNMRKDLLGKTKLQSDDFKYVTIIEN
jgi:hypothetical protein